MLITARHHRRPRRRGPLRAPGCATPAAPAATDAARQRRHAAGGSSPAPTASAGSPTSTGALARRGATLTGEGEFSAGGEPDHAGDPVAATAPTAAGCAPPRPPAARPRATPSTTCRLESYLRGVVPLEMPALWSAAAVRAQAVAARTYAAYERAHPRALGLPDLRHLVLPGLRRVRRRAPRLQRRDRRHPPAGADQRRRRRRSPSSASSSGGWTSAGSVSYLPASAGPVRRLVGQPGPHLVHEGHRHRASSTWPAIGDLTRMASPTRDGNGDWGGRVRSITLAGSTRRRAVSGDTLPLGARPALDLADLQGRPALSRAARRRAGRASLAEAPTRRIGA